jgi:hypothetical protein
MDDYTKQMDMKLAMLRILVEAPCRYRARKRCVGGCEMKKPEALTEAEIDRLIDEMSIALEIPPEMVEREMKESIRSGRLTIALDTVDGCWRTKMRTQH